MSDDPSNSIIAEARRIRQLGAVHLRDLSLWIHDFTYDQFREVIPKFSSDEQYPGVAVGHLNIDTPFLEGVEPTRLEATFRKVQIYKHELNHYRILCGTSAGIVTFLLSGTHMRQTQDLVSKVLSHLPNEILKNGFMPIMQLRARYACSHNEVYSIGSMINQSLVLQSHPVSYWLQTGAEKIPRLDFQKFYSPQAVQVFMDNLRSLEEFYFKSLPPKIELKIGKVEPPSKVITISQLLEAHARASDILFLCFCFPESKRRTRDDIGRSMYSKNYALAHAYMLEELGVTDATCVAFVIDLALMTPILSICSPTVNRPLEWADVHPSYRFLKIIQCMKDLPKIQQSFDAQPYLELCDKVCAVLDWPTPKQMAQAVVENLEVNTTRLGSLLGNAMAKSRHAAVARTIDPAFFACDVLSNPVTSSFYQLHLTPSIQFWADGVIFGPEADFWECLRILSIMVSDCIAEDCLENNKLGNSLALWEKIKKGFSRYDSILKSVDSNGHNISFSELIGDFLERVSLERYNMKVDQFLPI